MSLTKPTRAEIEAAKKVQRKLAWLPDYSSQDEIIWALRHLANRLQRQLDSAQKKLKR